MCNNSTGAVQGTSSSTLRLLISSTGAVQGSPGIPSDPGSANSSSTAFPGSSDSSTTACSLPSSMTSGDWNGSNPSPRVLETFTAEETERFQTRFEEKYDV